MVPKTRARPLPSVKAEDAQRDTDVASDDLKQVDKFKQVFYRPDIPSSDDDDDDNYGSRKRKSKGKIVKTRKSNKRLKVTDLERTPKSVALDVSDHEHDSTEENLVVYDPRKAGEKQTAGFQVVATTEGPMLKLDLFKMFAQNSDFINNLVQDSGLKLPGMERLKKPRTKGAIAKPSLPDLPIELARKIYRGVFVTDSPIDFTNRKNFSRSAALLRVCRKVHDEGTVVLYGHNAFHFRRVHDQRGSYYEEIWTEVGYKDVRRFFRDIGHHNIAKLKYVSFEFEDASPSYTSNLAWELRRYVNDGVLIKLLDMLAANAQLERLVVAFRGKYHTTSKDYQFLKAFCSIKTRSFALTEAFGANHIDLDTSQNLMRVMNEVEVSSGTKRKHIKEKKRKGPAMMHEIPAFERRRQ